MNRAELYLVFLPIWGCNNSESESEIAQKPNLKVIFGSLSVRPQLEKDPWDRKALLNKKKIYITSFC